MIIDRQLLPGAPPSARYHVAGWTETGPLGVPVVLDGMAEYRAVFGARTAASAALHDDLAVFFSTGGFEACVTRVAEGSTPEQCVAALGADVEHTRGAAVAVPQHEAAAVGPALMAHAADHRQVALLAPPVHATATAAATDASALTGAHGASGAVLLWPWVRVADRTGAVRPAPPTGLAAAARARAHALVGPWHHPAGPDFATTRLAGLVFPCDPQQAWAMADDLVSCLAATPQGVALWGWWSLSQDRSNFPHLTSRELLNAAAGQLEARYAVLGEATWGTVWKFTAQVRAATKAVLAGLATAGALTPGPLEEDGRPADDGYTFTITPDYEAAAVRVEVALRPLQYARMVQVRLIHLPLHVPMPMPQGVAR